MKKRLLLPALPLTLALVVACGSSVTRANFEKIENDMPQEEVIAILGEPADSNSAGVGGFSAGMATWRGDGNVITIQFVNGKVKGKQFSSDAD